MESVPAATFANYAERNIKLSTLICTSGLHAVLGRTVKIMSRRVNTCDQPEYSTPVTPDPMSELILSEHNFTHVLETCFSKILLLFDKRTLSKR